MPIQASTPKLVYSVNDLIAGGIAGRSKLYELIASGELRPVKLGGSTKFTAAEVERFLNTLPPAQIGGATYLPAGIIDEETEEVRELGKLGIVA